MLLVALMFKCQHFDLMYWFFKRKHQIYLHFLSFRNMAMAQLVEVLPHGRWGPFHLINSKQSSAVIARSNLLRLHTALWQEWRRVNQEFRITTHTPYLARPHGWAMGCLLWGCWRKLSTLYWHHTVLWLLMNLEMQSAMPSAASLVLLNYSGLSTRKIYNHISLKVILSCVAGKKKSFL